MSSRSTHISPRKTSRTRTEARATKNQLPVELWKEIFILATFIPGKDEFSVEGSAYNVMLCDGPTDNPLAPTKEEIRKAVHTRLQIVKVCKYWYSIGMPLLWSHLIVDLSDYVRSIECIYVKVYSDSRLASSVRRLDANARSRNNHAFYRDIDDILSRLPSLKIISCPLPLALSRVYCAPEVVILGPKESLMTNLSIVGTDFWRNARVMHINCEYDYIRKHPLGAVTFPRLEDLSITDKLNEMARYIMGYWHAPSLHTLSIECYGDIPWSSFLSRCSKSLEKLQLRVITSRLQPAVILPRLRVLYGDASLQLRRKVINAPQISCVGIYGGPWPIGEWLIIPEIYPTVTEVVIHGPPTLRMEPLVTRLRPYFEAWESKGIQIQIRC